MKFNNSEDNSKFSFIIFVILSVVVSLIQPASSHIMLRIVPVMKYTVSSTIVSGILNQCQLILFIFCMIKNRRKGFIVTVFLCIFNLISITVAVIQRPFPLYPIALVTNITSFIIILIINGQLNTISRNKDRMTKLKTEDELTGLANRQSVIDKITRQISQDPEEEFSLILIDLDNFKNINDSMGHQVGDIFLKEAAENLKASLPPEDFMGRMGGDEFIIMKKGTHSETELYQFAKRLIDSLSYPFIYRNREIIISASSGISMYSKDGSNASELFKHAEMALYRSKSQGKKLISFYNENMQKSIQKKLDIETELQMALERDEIYLLYQAQVDSKTQELRGYEVLSRWDSLKLGKISPVDFIPAAERTGAIVSLGKWIMEKACTQYMETCGRLPSPPVLAINISAVQLQDPDFLDSVKRIIKKTNMITSRLEFEITESVCIMNPVIIGDIFTQLKSMGIEIAMDDFGTGYSSLSYLSNFPFDIVKIDISFTKKILTEPPEKNLIKNIISMAHQLGLKVIAEGVEEQKQLDYLVDNNCDYIQGYYFSKPSDLK